MTGPAGRSASVAGTAGPLMDEVRRHLAAAGYDVVAGTPATQERCDVVVYLAGTPDDHGYEPSRLGPYVGAVLDGAVAAMTQLGRGGDVERSLVLVAPSVGATLTAGPESISAAIGALKGLSRAWAVDLGPAAVRCNVVLPGILARDVTESDRLPTIPLAGPDRRLGTDTDVAEAVTYLASTDASYLNGAELDVDGGLKEHRHAYASVLWDEGLYTPDHWPF